MTTTAPGPIARQRQPVEDAAPLPLELRSTDGPLPAWRKRINSHETFVHDSLDSLGYDWGRIADPGAAPVFPRKVYLPQTTDDVVAVVREAAALGEHLVVRSKGHSSNGLVLTGGTVLLTEKLDRVLAIDAERLTATVQAGAVSARIDDHLSTFGLGLPVIGDHNHITVGGFASVGGVSPASHVHGLFVDNVEEIELVDWSGDVVRCSRTVRRAEFDRVLTGQGRWGVLTALTIRLVRIDKYGVVLANDQRHFTRASAFVAEAARRVADPGDVQFLRGIFVDQPLGSGRHARIGQLSCYSATAQTAVGRARDRIAYTALNTVGRVAGRLPKAVDRTVKTLGMAGILLSPARASVKNIESFTDKVLDATAGDPTRMLVALVPLARFEELFAASWALLQRTRAERGCFTFLSVYVKGITSPYLAQGRADARFLEMMFYVGMSPDGLDDDGLEELVTALDDLCIAHGSFRYMHTRTSRDPVRRAAVDPNTYYARAAAAAEEARTGA